MRKVFILLFLICSISFGIELKNIDETLKSDFKKALNIMADSKISKEQKPLELFKLFDAYFDYHYLSYIKHLIKPNKMSL